MDVPRWGGDCLAPSIRPPVFLSSARVSHERPSARRVVVRRSSQPSDPVGSHSSLSHHCITSSLGLAREQMKMGPGSFESPAPLHPSSGLRSTKVTLRRFLFESPQSVRFVRSVWWLLLLVDGSPKLNCVSWCTCCIFRLYLGRPLDVQTRPQCELDRPLLP